jgi:cell division protein FtsI/penicillin-binding protein 2
LPPVGARRPILIAAVAIGALAVIAGGAYAYDRFLAGPEGPEQVIEEYVDAWERRDWPAVDALVVDPAATAGERHERAWEQLGVVSADLVPEEPVVEGDTATADFAATVVLAGFGEWSYTGSLDLDRTDDGWVVAWSPAVVHPSLTADLAFGLAREWPERASIVAHDGQPVASPRELVEIGAVPGRITDRPAVLDLLAAEVGADPDRVAADLDAPGVQPDWFVPVGTVRPDRFVEVDPVLRPVPGIVFRRIEARATPVDGFARQVVGRTGPITAELLEEWGPPYQANDTVGLSGLERVHERRLAGTPSGEVQLLDADGEVVETLHRFEGEPPEDVRTALDVGVQQAADAALADVAEPAALVAVDVATGDLRAVVSRPLDDAGRALSGRYPPGSTFKVITAAAALDAGLVPESPVDCPAEVDVGGRPVRNAGGSALGTVPFRTVFAQSCNTGFVQVARDLGDGALSSWAERFGFGATYDAGLDIAAGTFPEPADEAEEAAAAIGQGRVTASPAHMATAAAAVAGGEWRPPRLVLEPADGTDVGSRPVDPAVAGPLGGLMRAVVTEGTGTAAAVEGPPVAGKTGTAEFGTDDPPATHAWFIGFREGLAVAVLVEGGGGGGDAAAPLAGAFFRNLG